MFDNFKSVYYEINDIKEKIAAFDLDFTLIKPKNYKRFPKDKYDWEVLYDNVKLYLNSLIDNDYCIIIFTNQKGISKGKMTIEDFYFKIASIRKYFDINFSIFISTTDDKFRKPMTGMWDFLLEKTKVNVDYANSFYVGDAAGRIYKKKKDHSSDDLYFANNIKLKFFTPEKIFNQNDQEHKVKEFDLTSNLSNTNINISGSKNIILMVGVPASGKSYLSKSFEGYKIINQDKLKSKKKCLDKTNKYLKNSNNIIIDNTNPTKETRKEYLDLADKYGYNKYLINFNIPKDVAKYLNKYRTQTEGKKLIPDIVYNIYYKKFEEPSSEEGTIIEYDNYVIDKNLKF